jgi:hypothetical protein
MDVLNADVLIATLAQAAKGFGLHSIGAEQATGGRAQGRHSPLAAVATSKPDMAAVWAQAIWTVKAPSISSLGAAASIMANAALTAISEMPLPGRRAGCVGAEKTCDACPQAVDGALGGLSGPLLYCP